MRISRFNTQPPEGGWSTCKHGARSCFCFNTQPPEGGWMRFPPVFFLRVRFNTQPPEGGWRDNRMENRE